MSFLHGHGWALFILSEGLTWVAALMFLVSRYGFQLKRLSQWFLTCIILFTIFQGALAGIDYYITGKVSAFQVFIILFIVYTSTLGSSDFERIDLYIKQKIDKHHRTYNNDRSPVQTDSYVKHKQLLFIVHTISFFGAHLFWFFIDSNAIVFFYVNEWLHHPHQGLFHHPFINIISYGWSIIYLIDLYFYLINKILWWLKE
ncbi:hypothetical protein D7Z54_06345 [Salibacterium salarium]|uniref:Integral membrane protein n=1 Tax=Salibacterium salarium TaxID=284579 RepID=A0A3R9RFD7_9BACI|nr:hypothetical protein [Salibacterium salarium]RSL34181.1 hypothetical protein D7Z54_06345 [Salibacterium salarium]